MNKDTLMKELSQSNFIRLKQSPVEGIGVFAVADIKKGQRGLFSNDKSEWIKISKAEIETLPQHSKAMVENFCLYDEVNYYVPEYGFKMVDLVIFLNHADEPNILSLNEGDDFEALRDIKAGEELFVDYGKIVDD